MLLLGEMKPPIGICTQHEPGTPQVVSLKGFFRALQGTNPLSRLTASSPHYTEIFSIVFVTHLLSSCEIYDYTTEQL